MVDKIKKVKQGLGKLRGGKASRTGKKLTVSDFEMIPRPGVKTLTFKATVKSEFPSKRSKEARVQAKQIGKVNPKRKASLEQQFPGQKIKKRFTKYAADGKNPPAKQYKTQIQFLGVEFVDKKTDKKSNAVDIGKKIMFFESPDNQKARVSFKCTCSDFRHNFSWPLAKVGSLIGNKQTYLRVTPTKKFAGTGPKEKDYVRPPRPKNPNPHGFDFVNPKGHTGFCKHIFNFLKFLREKKLIKG